MLVEVERVCSKIRFFEKWIWFLSYYFLFGSIKLIIDTVILVWIWHGNQVIIWHYVCHIIITLLVYLSILVQ